jgi:hypothetical protein
MHANHQSACDVQVHRAHSLGKWSSVQGFEDQNDEAFDTSCTVQLLPLLPDGEPSATAVRSRIVDNSRYPKYAVA